MRFDATDYENLTEGQQFSPVEFSVTESMKESFQSCFHVDDRQLADAGLPKDEDGFVNPVLVANFTAMKAALIWPTGVLHAREQMRCHEPVACGEPLRIEMRLKQKFVKNGRKFAVLAIEVHKAASGSVALEVERTLVWPQ